MLRPGERVSDRYTVIEQIAEGGMGSLWLVHHEALNADVALKFLSATSERAMQRFKNEAQAVARLRAPNIVQVLDYGDHSGRPYLVMELLKGEDLAARLEREGTLPTAETVRILDSVAKALKVAHDSDVVHRDLKPANIFLQKTTADTSDDEAVVKVVDFGVAKDLRRGGGPSTATGEEKLPITLGGEVVGTPMYMSPEQVWGEEVGPRADVWGMGVVAFEMLTGVCPFADDTLAKIFERIVRMPIPSAWQKNPSLPPSIDVFFGRALAKDPAERFATTNELVNALRRCVLENPPSGGVIPISVRSLAEGAVTEDASLEAALAAKANEEAFSSKKTSPTARRRRWSGAIVIALVVAIAIAIAIRATRGDRRGASTSTVSTPTSAVALPIEAKPIASPASTSTLRPPVDEAKSAKVVSAVVATPPSISSRSSRALAAPSSSSVRLDPTFGIPIQ